MFALFCTDPRDVPRMLSAFPGGADVTATAAWDEFACLAGRAVCSVVVSDWLGRDGSVERLVALKIRAPVIPVILVTRRAPDNLRHLKDVMVEEVVWSDEVRRELKGSLRAAEARGPLCRLACAIERGEHIPPTLRAALAAACRTQTPPHSVTHFAALAACDRRTVWRQWRRSFAISPPCRLEDFLHWLVLLRAVGRKQPMLSWCVVASGMGVHEHTLARVAHRLAGVGLRELATMSQHLLLEDFARGVANALVRNGEWDNLGSS